MLVFTTWGWEFCISPNFWISLHLSFWLANQPVLRDNLFLITLCEMQPQPLAQRQHSSLSPWPAVHDLGSLTVFPLLITASAQANHTAMPGCEGRWGRATYHLTSDLGPKRGQIGCLWCPSSALHVQLCRCHRRVFSSMVSSLSLSL